jgi:hypothetical protein
VVDPGGARRDGYDGSDDYEFSAHVDVQRKQGVVSLINKGSGDHQSERYAVAFNFKWRSISELFGVMFRDCVA